MKGQTVTRFVVKEGDAYLCDSGDNYYLGEIYEAVLWQDHPPAYMLFAGRKEVMVSLTVQELPYEVK